MTPRFSHLPAPQAAAPHVASGRPSAAEYGVLKAREKELNDQRSNVEDRRNELSQQLDQKIGADRIGIQGRVSILDQRLAQIESDLAGVGRDLAATAPASIAEPPPAGRRPPVAPKAPTAPASSTGNPLEGLNYAQLKTRQSELQDQRQALVNRRASLARDYERAGGANREGIGARLAAMDRSLAQ